MPDTYFHYDCLNPKCDQSVVVDVRTKAIAPPAGMACPMCGESMPWTASTPADSGGYPLRAVRLPLETWCDVVMQLSIFRDMLQGACQSPESIALIQRTIDALRSDEIGLWARLVEAGLVKTPKVGGN